MMESRDGKRINVKTMTTQPLCPVVDIFPNHFDFSCLVGFFYCLSSDLNLTTIIAAVFVMKISSKNLIS